MQNYEYQFNRNSCWYLDACSKAETEECRSSCLRYMEMHYLLSNSGIPFNRQYPAPLVPSKQDFDAFLDLQAIKTDILSFVQKGHSLYIHSDNFGNGKTSWAIKLLLKYFDEVWAGNGFRCRGIFVHVPTLLTKIREGISRKDESFELMRSRLASVDVVVWDDIAATKLSDYDHANLLVYIDQRKLAGLANVFTGNLSGTDLSAALGNRLASRVWNDSTTFEFVGADRRGAK